MFVCLTRVLCIINGMIHVTWHRVVWFSWSTIERLKVKVKVRPANSTVAVFYEWRLCYLAAFLVCLSLAAVNGYWVLGEAPRHSGSLKQQLINVTNASVLFDVKFYKTSASVELTQTRHSHSKQLFQGGQISVFLQGGSKSFIRCL